MGVGPPGTASAHSHPGPPTPHRSLSTLVGAHGGWVVLAAGEHTLVCEAQGADPTVPWPLRAQVTLVRCRVPPLLLRLTFLPCALAVHGVCVCVFPLHRVLLFYYSRHDVF